MPLVDDLVVILSRFLLFLIISQDSLAIPSIQESCLEKGILSFWQDSCYLEFLPESFNLKFLSDSCDKIKPSFYMNTMACLTSRHIFIKRFKRDTRMSKKHSVTKHPLNFKQHTKGKQCHHQMMKINVVHSKHKKKQNKDFILN